MPSTLDQEKERLSAGRMPLIAGCHRRLWGTGGRCAIDAVATEDEYRAKIISIQSRFSRGQSPAHGGNPCAPCCWHWK